MEISVENKIVVVTGGAAGLGLEMANRFLENGARNTIIVDLNEQSGVNAAKDLCEKYGQGRADFIKCDVTADLESTYNKITSEYDTVDVLINNAGILNEKSVRQTIEVNTIALMEWTMKFYEFMRKDRGGNGGTIINVSSIFGFRVIPYATFYHASKFAVIGFSKSLGHEYNYKKSGVRVVVLCPGLTYTELSGNPNTRDDEAIPDLLEHLKSYEYQEVDAIGKGIIDIFNKADSGTVWLVEGSRPAVML